MDTAPRHPSLERVGLIASALCVVHCVATPLVLVLAPTLSARIEALEWAEKPLLALAVAVSLWLLYRGAWRRRQWAPIALFGAALVCLVSGFAVGGDAVPMTIAGGLFLGGAQLSNLRHRDVDCAC